MPRQDDWNAVGVERPRSWGGVAGKRRASKARAKNFALLAPRASDRGQSALESVFVLGIVVLLSLLVVGKLFSEQDGIYAKAAAREAAITGLDTVGKKYYLDSVDAVKCGAGTRVVYVVSPQPAAGDAAFLRIDQNIEMAVESAVPGAGDVNACDTDTGLLNCQNQWACS